MKNTTVVLAQAPSPPCCQIEIRSKLCPTCSQNQVEAVAKSPIQNTRVLLPYICIWSCGERVRIAVPGFVQSGVQNVRNGFKDSWCTSYAATGVHPGWHADTGQPCTNLEQAAHSKKHKTTHTHRSTPSRHRARIGPGPGAGLHCRAGLIQSAVHEGPHGFEDG